MGVPENTHALGAGSMQYRYEATSIAGFIQQLAVSYIRHGYFFYVHSSVPEGKDPRDVDRHLLEKFAVAMSRPARSRRKRAGHANVHYLRHGRELVLLATHGPHPFFDAHPRAVRDFRREPLELFGYSVGYRNGHVVVRMEIEVYREVKAHLLELASHRTVEGLLEEFGRVPFERFRGVRTQLYAALAEVNALRKRAGFAAVPWRQAVGVRRSVKPFEPRAEKGRAAPQSSQEAA